MPTLHNCHKLEIRNSPVEGFGIFATDDIAGGELLEEVPFILFPRHTNISKQIFDLLSQTGFASQTEKYYENLRQNLKFKAPEKYFFKWFPEVGLDGDPISFTVLPLGFGPIYNTANVDNNAGWTIKEKTFDFKAIKDIKKDEEIRTFYGYFVTEHGNIFNCDQVFNLAFDKYDGQSRCKLVRFNSVEQMESNKQNPSYARLQQLINISTDGLYMSKITATLPNGEERAAFDFPTYAPLSLVYQKLAEFKSQQQYPLIKLDFQYQNKESSAVEKESIIFKR